ncbi:diacylglycerol/lipid kinase family protein [Roseicella aquatilis]|uniref:Diacylglycerol kinase family lipid kinase n=1 Tax=Roseicella aquatilis TaxID=2527868 RepID=A0A4R4DFH6_9PROT|nr:diacylglycerol kinase family protein [Roseicella aquatilis]TCZ59682.1 diacylglycerol kinase family lipid kinase [Roseicella aquatilis]
MIIVFNPAAGSRGHGRLRAILAALAQHGVAPTVLETRAPGDAGRLARQAARDGARLVVAAGGDGTIAEVAQGILGSRAQLGILPLGTANVLAQELDIAAAPAALARMLTGGRLRLLRPGIARSAGGGTRLFVQMLGAGFDAAVVAALDLRLKRRLGRAAYVVQAVREMPRYPFPRLRVEVDGRVQDCASVIVSKGRFYAGRHLLAPAAQPDGPGFQVALFREGGMRQATLAGLALPLDLLPRLPGLTLQLASRVTLLTEGVPWQADGDPAGAGSVQIEEAGTPLPVRVP